MAKAKFVVIGLGLVVAVASAARYALDEAWTAGGWPTAEGQVISSSVADETTDVRSGTSTTTTRRFEPRIAYRYTAGGAERTGSRIWAGAEQSWGSRDGAERFIAGYPLLAPVPVRYDPEHPDRSYLVAGSPSIGWLVTAAVGVLLVLFGIFVTGRAPREAEGAGAGDG